MLALNSKEVIPLNIPCAPYKYIPEQAFRFFPSETQKKTPDGIRRIFDGSTTKYDQHETTMIAEFKKHCLKHKYNLTSIWKDSKILRFLQANNWKLEKTLQAVKEHTAWRESSIPPVFSTHVQDFLNSGIMYPYGRDSSFRPIIVFNAWKLDPKTLNIDHVIDALTYLFEFIMNELMLPGQVENWVFVLDLNKKGVLSLPTTPLKRMISYLQNNYRGHLWAMHVVNSPSSIMIPWTIIKGFLDENTVRKIQFSKNNVSKGLFQITNPEQVEKKYGGTASNLETFWPPFLSSENYLLPTQNTNDMLVSSAEYLKKYNNGELEGMKINLDLVKKEDGLLGTPSLKKTEIKTTINSEINIQKSSVPKDEGGQLESITSPKGNEMINITSNERLQTESDFLSEQMDESKDLHSVYSADFSESLKRYFSANPNYFKNQGVAN